MAIRIVRLGSDRLPGEGVRLGTVRRPPRGVRKADYASRNFYDVWRPVLAPSAALLRQGLSLTDARGWDRFVKMYLREMRAADASTLLNLLATLSHHAALSVGCYCAEESRCHRSVLRELLRERGALIK